MVLRRQSGILLHPTSLPGAHGSGDLGTAAYHFVDWLVAGDQTLWQILPLGGSGPGNSPYMSPSAFAGNELLIDLNPLRDAGWLSDDELTPDAPFDESRVDYPSVRGFRMTRLRAAAQRFFAESATASLPVSATATSADSVASARSTYAAFCSSAAAWLDDYALFMALDTAYGASGAVWQQWPAALARREASVLNEAAREHADECAFWKFCQWCFFSQWAALKDYANARGVAIVGDMPIFVSPHSADVWSRRALFNLDEEGWPRVVAGVPPDYFSASGQRWGNPLYDWEAHAQDAYGWWIARMRTTLTLCDIVRIDHFRGFESNWAIPAEAETAVHGEWQAGPGAALFTALRKALARDSAKPQRPFVIIAEDLGIITREVTALRQASGLPGMRILQFAFDGHSDNPYLPHNYDAHTVVYSGTHDNDTTHGWWTQLTAEEQDYVCRYLGHSDEAIEWQLIRAASASVAVFCIIPLQDVLGLDTSARMNQPGNGQGSWEWRFAWRQVGAVHAARLAELAQLHGRAANSKQPTDHR